MTGVADVIEVTELHDTSLRQNLIFDDCEHRLRGRVSNQFDSGVWSQRSGITVGDTHASGALSVSPATARDDDFRDREPEWLSI